MARRRYEDDDDYDPPPRRRRSPAPTGGGGNTAVKIIAIVAGVLVLIAAICGGLIWYAVHSAKKTVDDVRDDLNKHVEQRQKEMLNSDKAQSHQAANAFLQELKGRRLDAAYGMTTAAYQKRVPRTQFDALVEQFAQPIGRMMTFSPDVFAPDNGPTYHYEHKMADARRFVTLSVTMVKEGGVWKADQLSIEPSNP